MHQKNGNLESPSENFDRICHSYLIRIFRRNVRVPTYTTIRRSSRNTESGSNATTKRFSTTPHTRHHVRETKMQTIYLFSLRICLKINKTTRKFDNALQTEKHARTKNVIITLNIWSTEHRNIRNLLCGKRQTVITGIATLPNVASTCSGSRRIGIGNG